VTTVASFTLPRPNIAMLAAAEYTIVEMIARSFRDEDPRFLDGANSGTLRENLRQVFDIVRLHFARPSITCV